LFDPAQDRLGAPQVITPGHPLNPSGHPVVGPLAGHVTTRGSGEVPEIRNLNQVPHRGIMPPGTDKTGNANHGIWLAGPVLIGAAKHSQNSRTTISPQNDCGHRRRAAAVNSRLCLTSRDANDVHCPRYAEGMGRNPANRTSAGSLR
jgi:hypothetical protein